MASREGTNFIRKASPSARMGFKMENAPRDIMFNILSRVPLKSAIRFSCVSKYWFDVINDADFGKLHSHQTRTEPALLIFLHRNLKENIISINPLGLRPYELQVGDNAIAHLISSRSWNFIGTCNGLLCFTCSNDAPLLVCNPITQECATLPKPTTMASLESYESIFGFGFDSLSKKYKIIRLLCPRELRRNDPISRVMAEVYTLGGTGGWRAVQCSEFRPYEKPVYAAGALHLVVHCNDMFISKEILSFDFTSEEFKRTLHPNFGNYFTVVELGGHLAVVDFSSRNLVEVWVMKGENHWDREYIIPVHEPRNLDRAFPRLLAMLERDGILLIWLQDSLLSYERRTFRLRDLKISGLPTWLDWVICSGFRGSLVRLKDCCINEENSGSTTFFIRDTDLYSRLSSSMVEQKAVGRCDGLVACFVKNGMLMP